ncbi:MAG TPA: FGGY-family carbohydrate kinase [Actinomycetes bacterium]|nr:FGGY-family carbohydrate kinase [Actinomycetes bacterium]
MPEIRYLLALDLGTSGLKVAVTTLRGEIVTSAVERYPLHVLEDGGVEQDPGDWWDAIVRGTRRVLGHGGVDPGQVAGVACSSQWSGTVPVDTQGRPLMRAIIWMDARGAEQVHRITRGVPAVRGYGAAKLATWVHRSGGAPSHSGKDTLAHILFIRDRLPDLYRRTAKFLEPRDWLNFQLTGRMASSFDAATLLWAADTRDLGAVRYDERLLGLTGLDRDKLPDLVPTASVLGTLAPPAAAALGLPPTAPVVTGAPDILASAIGAGTVADFEAHLSIGTSSWLVCHVPFKKTDLLHNLASVPSAIPGRYLLANEQESAGVCLAELGHNILFPPDGGPPGVAEDPYPAMLAMAASVPAGSDGLIFAPWVNGERAPVDDRTVRGGFFNQSLGITRGHLVRAVLEGVAYNSRWLLGPVERFVGRRLEAVTAVGGGARSELWCQIHADVLDRVVHQAAEPVLANARGAALQASVALGHLRWDEVAGAVPIARSFEPDPARRRTYARLFPEFVNLYRSTRRIYARLNARR